LLVYSRTMCHPVGTRAIKYAWQLHDLNRNAARTAACGRAMSFMLNFTPIFKDY